MIRRPILVLFLALPLLGGCADLAAFTANTASELSGASPSQVTTLGKAVAAADLATVSAKIAVDSDQLDEGTLREVDALSTAVHTALTDLEAANAAGKNLNYSAFNAALDAWNSYTTAKGLKH